MATVIPGARMHAEPVLLRIPRQEVESPPSSSVEDKEDHTARARAQMEQIYQQGYQAGHEDGLKVAREQVHQQSFDQGRQAGREEGLAQARANDQTQRRALDDQLESLRGLIEAARASLNDGLLYAEDALVEIAFTALCRLLGDALLTRDGALACVKQCLQHAAEKSSLTARVSPRDLEWLRAAFPSDAEAAQGPRVEWVGDARVQLGGCWLEWSGGALDGRLETQLQVLRDRLLQAHAQSREEGA